ncbi:MAG: hypothetical protein H7318_08065 [Oligoflexus sp.]|nr:hypothetical protein [Oligoflexus sp.]
MKKLTIRNYTYENALGAFIFESVTVFVPNECKAKITKQSQLEDINYGLSADEIIRLEMSIGLRFFEENFRDIFEGVRLINANELRAIQEILFVNRTDFAKLLGLHKASITNLYKGSNMSSTIANLIMERLGNELSRPGASKFMLDGGAAMPSMDEDATERVNAARFRRNKTAS